MNTAADMANATQPSVAKRAVLFASGFGSRMLPITINTPKPLVKVKGTMIIETILDALVALDIKDIVIVRGYLADHFDILLKKYPFITFIDNPLYDSTNNISSAVAVAERDIHAFEEAYVFESDLFLTNPGILSKENNSSYYLGVPVDSTPDWCFKTKNGRITDLVKGGTDCHHMYGISYWTKEDGYQLAQDLIDSFKDETVHQRFWDDIPCVLRNENYNLHVKDCTFDDIAEIDSYAELCEIDPAYCIK